MFKNCIAALRRLVADVLDDFADVIHPGVRGTVDLQHIDGVAGGDLLTVDTTVARRRLRW